MKAEWERTEGGRGGESLIPCLLKDVPPIFDILSRRPPRYAEGWVTR